MRLATTGKNRDGILYQIQIYIRLSLPEAVTRSVSYSIRDAWLGCSHGALPVSVCTILA